MTLRMWGMVVRNGSIKFYSYNKNATRARRLGDTDENKRNNP